CGSEITMPLRPQYSRIITSIMLAIDRCSRSAAVRNASFRAGSMRKVRVVVLAVAIYFSHEAFVLHIYCNVQYSEAGFKWLYPQGASGAERWFLDGRARFPKTEVLGFVWHKIAR